MAGQVDHVVSGESIGDLLERPARSECHPVAVGFDFLDPGQVLEQARLRGTRELHLDAAHVHLVQLFQPGDPKTVGKGRGQIEVKLNAGITDELAKSLQKRARQVSPKVQARIQGDQLRVSSRDKDALQTVIKTFRDDDSIPVPLQFTNYR